MAVTFNEPFNYTETFSNVTNIAQMVANGWTHLPGVGVYNIDFVSNTAFQIRGQPYIEATADYNTGFSYTIPGAVNAGTADTGFAVVNAHFPGYANTFFTPYPKVTVVLILSDAIGNYQVRFQVDYNSPSKTQLTYTFSVVELSPFSLLHIATATHTKFLNDEYHLTRSAGTWTMSTDMGTLTTFADSLISGWPPLNTFYMAFAGSNFGNGDDIIIADYAVKFDNLGILYHPDKIYYTPNITGRSLGYSTQFSKPGQTF